MSLSYIFLAFIVFLNLTTYGINRQCSLNFILVNIKHGRFNNHLISLAKVVYLAKELNRSIILGCSRYKLNQFLDFPSGWPCIFTFDEALKLLGDSSKITEEPLLTFYKDPHKESLRCYYPNKKGKPPILIPLWHYNESAVSKIKGTILEHGKKHNLGFDVRIIAIPVAFVLPITDNHVNEIIKQMKPKKDLRAKAERFILEHFGIQPFIGVHLRSLEGHCEKKNKPNSIQKGFCQVPYDLIEKLIISSVPQPNKWLSQETIPIFIASDGQYKENEIQLRRYGALKRRHRPNSIEEALIDMWILKKAKIFIGNRYSSFSINVKRWRDLDNDLTLL